MNVSLNILIPFADERKNSSGKVKKSAKVERNLETWRHDRYYYYYLIFKACQIWAAANGQILEASKRSSIALYIFHPITTAGITESENAC